MKNIALKIILSSAVLVTVFFALKWYYTPVPADWYPDGTALLPPDSAFHKQPHLLRRPQKNGSQRFPPFSLFYRMHAALPSAPARLPNTAAPPPRTPAPGSAGERKDGTLERSTAGCIICRRALGNLWRLRC